MNNNLDHLSVRYIEALQQLPQYICDIDSGSILTHVMTGVRVSPILSPRNGIVTSGILEVEYPGGHKIQVYAYAFFKIALKEAAEIEISSDPSEFGISERKQTPVQLRIFDLGEHLRHKHSLK